MASGASFASARRCCTWVAASAFCFCASRGFFERVSIAMVTNARSGVRRTMASPDVTITGGSVCIVNRSCAEAGATQVSTTAQMMVRIRSRIVRRAPTKRYTVLPMKLEQFAMERMQSTYENQVEFNLSESGVHPLTLGELVDEAGATDALLAESLRYIQSNGTVALRALVASMYPGATPDHVQVTNGGAEANYVTTWHLVEPGDEVVMMAPNYMQT